MLDTIYQTLNSIHPWLLPACGLLVLALTAWLVDVIAKRQLVRLAHGLAKRSRSTWDDLIIKHGMIEHLAQILPAGVIYLGVRLVPSLDPFAITILQNLSLAIIALLVVLSLSAALSVVNDIYETRPDARKRPIKGYIQLIKIILFIVGAILVISALLDKSPLLLLSGFGALTAISLLIFKDTILSLVASVQLSSLDMVRVGDWIEMPQFNTDGDVIDVALHTIRVQNWDKTITTIPTHRLISDSFKNWRGMSESGGRRIKRALVLDMESIRFLSSEEIEHFQRFALLKDYIAGKQTELNNYNANLETATTISTDQDVNLRRLTNLGTFRAYVFNYLKHHPDIHDHMTLLVRQLQPQPEGIPLEIYCFTKTTDWNAYEGIQGDIFEHLLAILREFGLRTYQQPSGASLQHILGDANHANR